MINSHELHVLTFIIFREDSRFDSLIEGILGDVSAARSYDESDTTSVVQQVQTFDPIEEREKMIEGRLQRLVSEGKLREAERYRTLRTKRSWEELDNDDQDTKNIEYPPNLTRPTGVRFILSSFYDIFHVFFSHLQYYII